MLVDNEVFYHIHTPDNGVAALEVGKEYVSGNTPNRFWHFYSETELRCGVQPYHGGYASITLNRHINSPLIENNEINKAMLNYSATILRECGMFIRELVFEEVRSKEFPDSPSRRTALYVTDKAGLDYWMTWFTGNPRPKYIYRVQCSGVIHRGSQQFLDSDITSYSAYAQEARNYWSGTDVEGRANTELLFQGKWRVLDLIGEFR